jgi:energy-coupling factor transport system permease protein
MLKDITLGQFFPGNSVIHRLDPRVKILLMLCYITALFMAKGVYAYAALLCFLCVSVAVSSVNPRQFARGLKPMVFIIVFTALLNVFYTPGERILLQWSFITVTLEGVMTALFMVARILMLISSTFLLTYTTSPIMLTNAMERLLAPLIIVRLPVHELSMMMTIAMRMIPTLIEETDKIMSAQKARGADFESGNIIRRARALIPLLVPLFVSSFRRADEFAVAMECRCYHGGEGRTKMNQLRVTRLDLLVSLCVLLFLSGGVAVGFLL